MLQNVLPHHNATNIGNLVPRINHGSFIRPTTIRRSPWGQPSFNYSSVELWWKSCEPSTTLVAARSNWFIRGKSPKDHLANNKTIVRLVFLVDSVITWEFKTSAIFPFQLAHFQISKDKARKSGHGRSISFDLFRGVLWKPYKRAWSFAQGFSCHVVQCCLPKGFFHGLLIPRRPVVRMVKMSGVPFCRSWVWLVHGRLAKGLFRLELPVCLDSSVSSCGPLPVFNECRVLGGTLAGGTQLRKFSTSGQKDATNETNATGNMVRVDSPNKPNISYDRNFITTTRALTDFMLKPTDLKSEYLSRWRSSVIGMVRNPIFFALQVWGWQRDGARMKLIHPWACIGGKMWKPRPEKCGAH